MSSELDKLVQAGHDVYVSAFPPVGSSSYSTTISTSIKVNGTSEVVPAFRAQEKPEFTVLRGGGRNPPILRLLSYTSG